VLANCPRHVGAMAGCMVLFKADKTRRSCFCELDQLSNRRVLRFNVGKEVPRICLPVTVEPVSVTNVLRATERRRMKIRDACPGQGLAERGLRETLLSGERELSYVNDGLDASRTRTRYEAFDSEAFMPEGVEVVSSGGGRFHRLKCTLHPQDRDGQKLPALRCPNSPFGGSVNAPFPSLRANNFFYQPPLGLHCRHMGSVCPSRVHCEAQQTAGTGHRNVHVSILALNQRRPSSAHRGLTTEV
jgi:hypothetical protein